MFSSSFFRDIFPTASREQTRWLRRWDRTAAIVEGLEQRTLLAAFSEFVDPNPNPGNQFGRSVVPLSTGNVVITSPYDDAGGTDAGAVYLFNGATGALISTLRGSHANDNVGGNGITPLSNGNYLIPNPNWDNGSVGAAGAVTWGSGTNGVAGEVSAINSLVGSTAGDKIGNSGITELANGNYVVRSNYWDNGSVVDAGAVTWGSGTTGVAGVVSANNSLVGSSANDLIGIHGITVLSNGNYVVNSPRWDNGAAVDAGVVTWGSGTTGVSGVVSVSNSLVGSTALDGVGYGGITALTNGNYVVNSAHWDNGAVVDAGAVTWGSGTTGVAGVVSASNSLHGSTAGHNVGYGGITALTNGNYVVNSPRWDNGAAIDAGALTWGSGTTGMSGVVSVSNSLVGSTAYDQISNSGITELANGNYVVRSNYWDNGSVVDAGAVTWGSGTTGVAGVVSANNSLVGSSANDLIGIRGITVLSNGNYVVNSPRWDNGAAVDAGAVTWGSGTTGVSGVVSVSNSLVGSKKRDEIGYYNITLLTNGNYVVVSNRWDNGAQTNAGAVTWGNGTTGVTGVVSASNSLVGSSAFDEIGGDGITELTNGNYVVSSHHWHNGSVVDAGAVTWGSGTTGVAGVVSVSNSLVGNSAGDQVGIGITTLTNGNYVVRSDVWDEVGAATWGNGTTGVTGLVSASNSLVGATRRDGFEDSYIIELSNGNYVVNFTGWDNGAAVDAGAVTWGSGTTGVTGVISSSNSLVGSSTGDKIGYSGIALLTNGNYVIDSPFWDNGSAVNAGAVTWGRGTAGVAGVVSASNSLVGLSDYTYLQYIVVDDINGTFYAPFFGEGGGRVRVGVQDRTTFSFSAGVLVIEGTALGDSIVVLNDAGIIKYQVNEILFDTGLSSADVTAIIVNGHGGDDFIELDSSLGATVAGTLGGGEGLDTLRGGEGRDTLLGGEGFDKLYGGAGTDSLDGGAGDDRLYFDELDVRVFGGAGNDSATVYLPSAGVNLNLTENEIETAGATISTFNNMLNATGATWAVTITGGNGNDTITGGNLNDKLNGGGGNDRLTGGLGADSLHGGDAKDALFFDNLDTSVIGGSGSDTAFVDAATAAVNLNLVTSQIEIVSATTSTFNNTFNAAGATFVVKVTGGSGNDTITGGNLSDKLYGGAGADSLDGGAGDDRLYFDELDVRVFGGAGIDSATVYLPSAGVNLNLTANEIEVAGATISTFDNTLSATGATWAVTITGGSGNDTITGGDWNDTLDGGTGNDTLAGRAGSDKLSGRAGIDSLDAGADNDMLFFDNLDTSVIGGAGVDTAFVRGATAAVNLNLVTSQIETVSASTSTFNNTLNASGAMWVVQVIGGSGNDTIIGGDLNDTLDGGAGNDTLTGNGGADKLYGRAGADSLNGGDANDQLYFDNLDTSVIGAAGVDTAFVTAATAAVNLNLTTGQIENASATTSTFHNLLNATGATWAVTIFGGTGNDTLFGGNLNDKLFGGGGIDTVSYAFASAAVAVNLANKKATGGAGTDTLTTIENVIGSNFADTIYGDVGNNILNGGAGVDTIIGGGGVDTILNA